MSGISINPAVIIQGSVTLITAITCSDIVKDIILASKFTSPAAAIGLRILLLICIITFVVLVMWYLPKDSTLQRAEQFSPLIQLGEMRHFK